jgi:predicted nucleic acid-binding protein
MITNDNFSIIPAKSVYNTHFTRHYQDYQDACQSRLLLNTRDALVSACAENIKADYIISRDEKFLKDDSPVKVITPKEFLQILTEK